MDTLRYEGSMKKYFTFPLYMIAVFVIATGVVFYYSPEVGKAVSIFVVIYSTIVVSLYKLNSSKFQSAVIDYAVHYSTVQKELISSLNVPYAILDDRGRFMWLNDEFCKLIDKSSAYDKSIATVFPDITREYISEISTTAKETIVTIGKRSFRITIQPVQISAVDNEMEIRSLADEAEMLYTVLLFDETDLITTKQAREDESMVAAHLYIDNYEDVFSTVEQSKQTMLIALIDRKINRYFQNTNAIIRRLEKDKYLILFQHKYLKNMVANKFSLVEEIRSIKMGNDSEITVSMGVGLGGDSYIHNVEYAHMAIDIALGRGGAQTVVKNGNSVEYFSSGKVKESDKNISRVKARVKAQALRELISTRDRVIVMGHKISDADCMGASIGVFCAAKQLGKPVHIVLNTITSSMRPIVESFTQDGNYPWDMFINSEQALNIIDDKTLVMVVDTNRPSYVECPELLEKTKDIVVIDHHRRSDEVIENPILSYVEPYASSASEMIAEVLQYFSEKLDIDTTEADAIYAGILIDTNNFMTKTGVRTFEAAAFLRRNGAEVTRVRKLLREDMSAYKAKAEIIRNAEVYKQYFAISVLDRNDADDIESPTVVGAQAANELLNIVGIKASFVLTEYKEKIFISSRSIDEIDVQRIMERLGGGGHVSVAGAQLENTTMHEAKVHIKVILDDMLDKGELNL